MKRYYLNIITIVAVITVTLLPACRFGCVHGSGNQVSEIRKVAGFSRIDVSGAFKIILKQDSSLTVNINTDDNLVKYVKTDVSGDKLRISTRGKNICTNGPIVITIGIHHLGEIKSSGAVDFETAGKLVTGDLSFKLSGITKINMELDAANVSTESSGASEINLKGQASSHSVDLNGGGKIHAFDFVVGNYNISTSGASDCEINVLHQLNVKSSGASSIKYKGNPSSVNSDKSGISSITKVN